MKKLLIILFSLVSINAFGQLTYKNLDSLLNYYRSRGLPWLISCNCGIEFLSDSAVESRKKPEWGFRPESHFQISDNSVEGIDWQPIGKVRRITTKYVDSNTGKIKTIK